MDAFLFLSSPQQQRALYGLSQIHSKVGGGGAGPAGHGTPARAPSGALRQLGGSCLALILQLHIRLSVDHRRQQHNGAGARRQQRCTGAMAGRCLVSCCQLSARSGRQRWFGDKAGRLAVPQSPNPIRRAAALCSRCVHQRLAAPCVAALVAPRGPPTSEVGAPAVVLDNDGERDAGVGGPEVRHPACRHTQSVGGGRAGRPQRRPR